ncbi:hypothetical protein EIP86_005553 [Pleurotus ostreatoroseus]|nr:hypothetical protein EIP86_005553 [Pleurotus ostreatoroseus]
MANRIIQMAPERLPEVPDIYPIDDICMKRNDPNCIQTIKSQGKLGALRKPDNLILRKRDALKIPPLPTAPEREENADSARAETNEEKTAPRSRTTTSRRKGRGRTRTSAASSTRRMATRDSTRKAAAAIVVFDPLPEEDTNEPDIEEDDDDDKPRRVRWVDVIMSIELKGKASLIKLLRLFLKDPNEYHQLLPVTADLVDVGADEAVVEVAGKDEGQEGRPCPSRLKQHPLSTLVRVVENVGVKTTMIATTSFIISDVQTLRPTHSTQQPHLSLKHPKNFLTKSRKPLSKRDHYALETLACTFGTRLYCINILVKNDRLYFWYYDACGFIYTESISVVEDFEKFAAIVVAIACSSPTELGALPSFIEPPQHAPYPKSWPPESLKDHTFTVPRSISLSSGQMNDVQITLQDPVFAHYVLAGRRTFVYTIKTNPTISDKGLIVKFSYQVSTRRQEHELIEIAHKAGIGHLPRVHAWGNHWKMSDSVRQIFYEKAGAEYEDRTLRSIVYSKYLPLETLFSHSPQHIPTMAYQLIDCVHDLRYKANILHRDISVNNVMYTYRGSFLYFILIDFDMATVLEEDYVPSSKHRTGTLAFMAVALIRDASLNGSADYQPIVHMLCHEYESIYWLCLWCTLVFVAVATAKQRLELLTLVRAWETVDLWQIADTKLAIRGGWLDDRGIKIPQAAREANLERWFWRWTRIWAQLAFNAIVHNLDCKEVEAGGLAPAPLDYETAGELLTRDNLRKQLTAIIPDPYEDVDLTQPHSDAGNPQASAASRHSDIAMDDGPTNSGVPDRALRAGSVLGEDPTPPSPKPKKATSTKKVRSKRTKKTVSKVTRKAAETAKPSAKARPERTASTVNIPDNDIRRRLRPRK